MTETKKKGTTKHTSTELVNLRFYENHKRQALLTTSVDDQEEVDVERSSSNKLLLSSVKTTELCDTVEDKLLKNPNPPPSLDEPVSGDSSSVTVSSSSLALAISAPSDKSRKGSVDKKIWKLVNLINTEKDSFFTTSSCSGRIILYTWRLTGSTTVQSHKILFPVSPEEQKKDVADGNEEAQASSSEVATAVSSSKLKKGCKWLLVSHDEIQPEELVNAYLAAATTAEGDDRVAPTGERDVYFKMEPCILHVQCRTLTNARKLIHIATESGFRNSGMVIGKENRITVAIRSAMGLEVPLPRQSTESHENQAPHVSEMYLKYLAESANAKMRENWLRSEKLTKLFEETSWS